MKTVVLFGSPRKNGCTAQLMNAFCSALPENTSVSLFDAGQLNVRPCLGCGYCEEQWGCVSGDMDEVVSALLECDLLVIASPVYHLSFPSPLKAMIDRLQPCYCAHRRGLSPFAEKERKAVVLLAAGSPSENGDIIRRQLRWVLPTLNAHLCGMTVCANTDVSGVTEEAVGQAKKLAQELLRVE